MRQSDLSLKTSYSQKLPSTSEMKELEISACSASGKTILDLMEAAGSQVAAFIDEQFGALKKVSGKIVILCGAGNNGGDGLVAGRLLALHGYSPEIILIDSPKYTSEYQAQITRLRSEAISFKVLASTTSGGEENKLSLEGLRKLISNSAVLLDCLLGSGQLSPPRGIIKDLCEELRSIKVHSELPAIVSVDVPTGVNCDSGMVYEPSITADRTIVIQHLKRGLLQSPASDAIGEVFVVDAGMDGSATLDPRYNLLTADSPVLKIPRRQKSAHKGMFGHILVVAGSNEMPGAATLSSGAALRCGGGLVTQLRFAGGGNDRYPEIMYLPVDELNDGLEQKIRSKLNTFSCILLGPGLGLGPDAKKLTAFFLDLIETENIPAVIDADGLNHLAEIAQEKTIRLPSAILTPHPGEAARLLNTSTNTVQSDRYSAAEKISGLFSATVVLKGNGSICYNGQRGWVNSIGGPFLATPGSGDVLGGMIAAFLAAGQSPLAAAALGIYLHADAGEMAARRHGGPIIASDIIEKIPFAYGKHVEIGVK